MNEVDESSFEFYEALFESDSEELEMSEDDFVNPPPQPLLADEPSLAAESTVWTEDQLDLLSSLNEKSRKIYLNHWVK